MEPIKTIAEQWKVSRTTIYRYLNKLNNQENKEIKILLNFKKAKNRQDYT